MAKKLYEESNIQAIADAIRAKTGGTDKMKPAEFAAKIASISGGDIDSVIDRSLTEISSNVTSVGYGAFYDSKNLTSVSLPLAEIINSNAFYKCNALKEITLPSTTSVEASAFNTCTKLETAVLPKLQTLGTNAFYNCYLLTTADLGTATKIQSFAFRYCYNLKAVILRSTTMCTLAATTVFSGCSHINGTIDEYNLDGLQDGYIYVPAAVVSAYVADSVWSGFAFRALEDYTVDGTITGALDKSKI